MGPLMGQVQWQWQHPNVIRRQKSVEANDVSAMRQKQEALHSLSDQGRIVVIGTCTEQCCFSDGSPFLLSQL